MSIPVCIEPSSKPEVAVPSRTPASASDQNIILAAKGGGIAFTGNMFVYAFRFGFGVVMARMLGADLFGLYSLALTVTNIIGSAASFGMSSGMARYIPIAIAQKDERRLWGTIQTGIVLPAVFSVILGIGLFAAAGPLSYLVFERPDMMPALRVASFGVPLLTLMGVLASITQGFKRMEYKVYSEDIALNLSKLVLSMVLLSVGLGVVGGVLAHVVSMAIAVIMLFWFVHRLFSLNRPVHTAERRTGEMLRFSMPVYLSQLLGKFSGSIETLVLGFFGVMSGVGIYTTALRLSGVGAMFHHSLQRIAIPMIADLHSRGKMKQLGRVYRTTTKWDLTFNLPLFLVITILAKPLLAIFGTDFVAGSAGLVILAVGTVVNASTGVCGSVVTMTGHSKVSFVNSIIHLVATVALDLVFIPRLGVVGAALGVMLSNALINVVRLVEMVFLLRIRPYDRSFLKPVLAAVAAAVPAYLVNQSLISTPWTVQLGVGVPLLVGIYVLAIVLLGLSDEDRLILERLQVRLGFRRRAGA